MAEYPLSELQISGFGPFGDINLELSPNLNIVTGDNGTGKSQLLKLFYACTRELSDTQQDLTKTRLNQTLADALVGVFRPEGLGRLTRRARGTSKARVRLKYRGIGEPLDFSFSSRSRKVDCATVPNRHVTDTPVFFPSRELLSLYPGLVSLFETREVEFDETWRDTALLLGQPPLRGPRGDLANEILDPVLAKIEGSVVEENGRFYVHLPTGQSGTGKIEAHLVSEGYRKLAMVIRMVSNGVLLEGGYLFWDEPEANLNPETQRALAAAIVALARSGTQVFVATHSVYLLREFEILLDEQEEELGDAIVPRYIGLYRGQDIAQTLSDGVTAESVVDPGELSTIAALEAESEQSFRYLEL